MKVLAMDPGVKNYAYSVITDKPDIIFTGHLNNPLQSIKQNELRSNICDYKRDIRNLFKKINFTKGDIIAIERYQSRGHKNLQIELVNIMIGVIAGKIIVEKHENYSLFLITPSTWKNFIKNKYGTNEMTKIITDKNLSPHIKDTIGIATYIFEKKYNTKILDKLKDKLKEYYV